MVPVTPLAVLIHFNTNIMKLLFSPVVCAAEQNQRLIDARKAEVVVRVATKIIGLIANAMFVSPARSPSIITLRTTVGITLDTTQQATPAPQENIPLPEATAKTALQESTKMEPVLGVTLATRER